jgi:hypothetical protein
MSITTRCLAAQDDTGKMIRHTIQRRAVGDADVHIKVRYSGICHSDIHTAKGDWGPQTYPQCVGHEILGDVVAVGSAVTKFKVGDVAGVGCFTDSCRKCEEVRLFFFFLSVCLLMCSYMSPCLTSNNLFVQCLRRPQTLTLAIISRFVISAWRATSSTAAAAACLERTLRRPMRSCTRAERRTEDVSHQWRLIFCRVVCFHVVFVLRPADARSAANLTNAPLPFMLLLLSVCTRTFTINSSSTSFHSSLFLFLRNRLVGHRR